MLVKSLLKALKLCVSSRIVFEREAHVFILSSVSSEDPLANTSVVLLSSIPTGLQ